MRVLAVATVAALTATAGTFGTVVPIGGEASDLTLDEARGVLYIADFTANRIEVMSLASNTIQSSMNVAAQPSSMDMSPDGHYLVVTHYGNFAAPLTASNLVTVIDLTTRGQQTLALPAAPLGVAFGADGMALVATASEFLVLDPSLGTFTLLATVSDVTETTLPAPPANFPATITDATLGASGDRTRIFGLTSSILISYNATNHTIASMGFISSPPMGPLTISVDTHGASWAAGWIVGDPQGHVLSQFSNTAGLLSTGTIVIDSTRNRIYAQMAPSGATAAPSTLPPPVLMITDADNLTIDEQVQLPENLGGKSVITKNGSVMYSISDSGVTVLPLAQLPATPQIQTAQSDILFTGSYCNRGVATQNLTVFDPSGNQTPFSIATAFPGIAVQPASGVTPAVVQVSVDPTVYANQNGTATATLQITSPSAVNVPNPVRVLVNTRSPDQRGTIIDVPGTLVDILPDPVRNQFYVLRQDQNQVLVFDGSTYSQIATLRTNNTPTQMAITYDDNWLLVGHDNSQLLYAFNLNTLQPATRVFMPYRHYPRSVAASANAILAANRVAGPLHTIDRVDLASATATTLPSLGPFQNSIDVDTVLVAAPNGSGIMAAEADGNVLWYDSTQNTFTISRQDYSALGGAYATSSWGFSLVDGHLLNASLVTVAQFENQTGSSSGFAFLGQTGFRSTASSTSAPGVIERVDVSTPVPYTSLPVRTAEAPLAGNAAFAFTRTLAPLSNQKAIVELTTSGLTVLPWAYDASVAPPNIDQVVSAADGSPNIAPGGLISLYGEQLSPISLVASQIPLPTALGDSCLTVDGLAVPVMFVSPSQINAQLPFEASGNVTFTLLTPGGISNNFNTVVSSAAPSVFMSGAAGPETGLPTIIRANNDNQLVTASDPIHGGDTLVIYLTGLGLTSPQVADGAAAPLSPLAYSAQPVVTLGGAPLDVFFSGLTPTLVGVYQINATVPKNVTQGLSVPLAIGLGGNATTINVRVVN
ncbi:MAG: hypothetical protein ABSF98_11065 [Bryobacteraceae bacterium]